MPCIRYKCNHCLSVFETMDEAIEHEGECLYAPGRKHCSTCQYKHYDGYPFGGPHVCSNKKNIEMYWKEVDYVPKEFNCKFWEEDI